MRLLPIVLSLVLSASAHALPVTPAEFSYDVNMPGFNEAAEQLPAPITWSHDVQLSPGQSIVSINQTGGLSPMVDIQTHADVHSTTGNPETTSMFAIAESQILYNMRIDGPENQLVPLQVFVRGDVSGSVDNESSFTQNTQYGWGSASVLIFGYGTWFTSSYWNRACPANATNCTQDGSSSFALTETFEFVSGAEYQIVLRSQVEVRAAISALGGPLAATSEVQAVADPTFTFQNPGDAEIYSLSFSPNIVPAPAAAWPLGASLLAILWARRRVANA